jgi:hypothetical protein
MNARKEMPGAPRLGSNEVINTRYTNWMDTPSAKARQTFGNEHLYGEVDGSEGDFLKKIYRPKDPKNAWGVGQFTLSLSITCLREVLYIPLSVASGKKPTGFIYQIEGTAEGSISSAKISCKGEEITQITLGTLRYVKISRGKRANFRMTFTIEGDYGKEYKIVVNQVNYKFDPGDARYKKFDVAIETAPLEFRK